MATVMKQAEFARRHGVSEKSVTMWKKRGWVVTCDGKVNVEESEANLKKYRAAGISKSLTSPAQGKAKGKAGGNAADLSPMAQLLALDWISPVSDWSPAAQVERARLACECVGDVVMERSSSPIGDGNWGGFQLRDPDAYPVTSPEQIWAGFGYELEPCDILHELRLLVLGGDPFDALARPDLLHALALPIYEWAQEPPSASQPLGNATMA